MFLTENEQKWSNIITEEYGVKDANKLAWMSKYAQIHSLYEAAQQPGAAASHGIYATPLNVMGMGNPMMPYNLEQPGAPVGIAGGEFGKQAVGSGDIPMSTLTMALQVAAVTVGFELVPVIPATGPWAMLSYMDFPYAGGKLGRINETWADGKGLKDENKPIYVKVIGHTATDAEKAATSNFGVALSADEKGGVTPAYALVAKRYLGDSRIDGAPIYEVAGVAPANGTVEDLTAAGSIADCFKGTKCHPDLVTSAADHIQGFANFFNGSDDPMGRGENETGKGNMMGARMYTKLVQMGSLEVTGAVTRQQLQDMPLYGVDVIGKVLEHMQNEISQGINNRILDRVFRLGVTNAANQYKYQGVNLNLFMAGADAATKKMNQFASADYYIGIDKVNEAKDGRFKDAVVKNALFNTAAETSATVQRRIMSRMLAAANLIAVVSRRGRGTWACANAQIITACQDAANYVVNPMQNTLVQDGSQSLYFAGAIAGLNLYVDPYMKWNDNRVCVGRKSNGNDPGVIFMPYILADTIQTTAEGTMAPTLLVNSRFAIVDAGFWPEQSYYTFMVECDNLI